RVELWAQTRNGGADLRAFLRDYFSLDPSNYESHLYEYREQEAIRHLFRVAASLDSMVVGEPQILGQVKEAYATARDVGAVHAQPNWPPGSTVRRSALKSSTTPVIALTL